MTHTPHEPLTHTHKLLGLELIRFVSAVSVLVWHYQHFFYIAATPTGFIKKQQPFYSALRLFYDYGLYGVHVFWCISGFIFFWKYRDTIAAHAISYKKFFVLRFSRLYPLHIVTLLLVCALQALYFANTADFFVYQHNDLPHFISQLFLASNWGFEQGDSFNGPIWSISIEVLVYGVFFTLLRVVSKSVVVNIAVLLLCVAATSLGVTSPILLCLAFFYIGGVSAIAFKYVHSTKYYRRLSHLAGLALLALPLLAYKAPIYPHKHAALLFLMSYTPVLLFVSAQNLSASPLVQDIIEAAGNMTYSSYLIHFPLQLAIALYFKHSEQQIPYYSTVFFSGFITVTLVLSYYIYRLFELPAQHYVRRKWA